MLRDMKLKVCNILLCTFKLIGNVLSGRVEMILQLKGWLGAKTLEFRPWSQFMKLL